MKALILAAGRGKRMKNLTDHAPKPLLKIKGKALIEYHIESLAAAGIRDIIINHSYLGHMIEQHLGSGQRFDVAIQYSPEQHPGLETGGGIVHALPLIGNNPFIVINGDIWTDYPYSQLRLPPSFLAHIVLVDNPPHHNAGDFSYDQNRLSLQPHNKLTFSGIGIYHPAFFSTLETGTFPLAPIIRAGIKQTRVSAEHYQGIWHDVGTPDRLHALNV